MVTRVGTFEVSVRDYSKLDLLQLFGVVKIFLELEIKITGHRNSNFISTKSQM